MAATNSRRQCALMLRDLRQRLEDAARAWEGINLGAQKPDLSKAIETSITKSRRVLDSLGDCFVLIVLIDDPGTQLVKAQDPTAQELSILARATDLVDLQIAEYTALASSADPSGYCAALLEWCLGDTRGLLQRTRHLIGQSADKPAQRIAESSAA